jgi:hypothetical protein
MDLLFHLVGHPKKLCMSIDPLTGAEDGPSIVVGGIEYTSPKPAHSPHR